MWYILIGFLLSLIFAYLIFIYLGWVDSRLSDYKTYTNNPELSNEETKKYFADNSYLMISPSLAEGYKPLNFWIKYYSAKYDLPELPEYSYYIEK